LRYVETKGRRAEIMMEQEFIPCIVFMETRIRRIIAHELKVAL